MTTNSSVIVPVRIIVEDDTLLRLRSFLVFAHCLFRITLGPRGVTAGDHADGLEDVEHEDGEQAELGDVDERVADQPVRILVERVRSGDEEKIAGEMSE